MNEINTKWNLGNFAVSLTTKVDDAMRDKLAEFGLRFLGQRVSAVDRILGGFEKGTDGKAKRRKDWKRTDAAFSTDLANKLAEAFDELVIDDTTKLAAQATFTEYVPTAGEPKFKTEKELCARHESKTGGADGPVREQSLAVWLAATVGYEGPTHGDDGEFNVEMLQAVKVYVKENV